jgi:phosphate-selective porin OprO/OprP
MKIGGQAQNDTAGFASDGTQPVELERGVEWRRARLYALGTFRKRWTYKFQWDFTGDRQINLIDAWLQFRFNLFGRGVALRSGRFGTTFGLENDGSSNDTLFMEQGFTLAFVPPQETGVLLHSESARRRWDLSFSSGASELECLICNVLGIAGRYSMGFDLGRKDRLLHVGVNASRRWTDDAVSYTQRPESHIAPVFVDTGPIRSERVDAGLLEGAFLQGPFSLQGEYVVAGVKQPDGPRPVFYAFYLSGSYALTGEMRQYRHDLGTIRRIRPKRELRDGSGGLGAFEVALRFSRIDLNDQDITGGTLNDLSFAFNWYPTYPTRVSFNMIRSKREAWNPVWIFQARLQLAY